MHNVQFCAAPIVHTRWVIYKDNDTEDVAIGYNVCYDTAVGDTPAAGEWDEMVRGRVVTKPKTGHKNAYAGVIVGLGRRLKSGTDYTRLVQIAEPHKGTYVNALTHANMTAETTVLMIGNDDWGLVAQTLTAEATELDTVAIACDTVDTSSTAAVKKIRFV